MCSGRDAYQTPCGDVTEVPAKTRCEVWAEDVKVESQLIKLYETQMGWKIERRQSQVDS